MWTTEQSIEAKVAPGAIWRLWADVSRWPEWNAGVDQAELAGPFAAGSTITMTPPGEEPIVLRLAEVASPRRFTDEADLGDVVVRTTHSVEPSGPGRVRVVYRMEISGPAADSVGPEIGPQISSDFPDVLAALVKRAGA